MMASTTFDRTFTCKRLYFSSKNKTVKIEYFCKRGDFIFTEMKNNENKGDQTLGNVF